VHAVSAVFVVAGERHSAIIETGITCDTWVVLEQLDKLVELGVPTPRYILPTHAEMGHAGGVGHLLERYPEATVHGDVSDLHLVFPQFADRLHFADPEIVVVESVFRDLLASRWYFDTKRRVLFPGDGFAFSHFHTDAACGLLAEEASTVDITAGMAHFAIAAFHWTQFVDIEPYIARLDELLRELAPDMIAPTHGLPIGDPAATMPIVKAGLRAMSRGQAGKPTTVS
jgi:glyoxylase-like metal-dependent hydrolase (beta-lactamase superfamily II)